MSLSDRLRAEACTVRPTVDDGLAARVSAAVRAAPGGPPLIFPAQASRRVWPWLAAAASVAVLVGLAWQGAAPPVPAQAPPLAVVTPPSAPVPATSIPVSAPSNTLSGMLASIPAGGPLASELNALGADLTAAARTVRGVVPF
jgi:hypothetical protein